MRRLPGRPGRIFFAFRAVLEEPGPEEDEAEEPTAGPWSSGARVMVSWGLAGERGSLGRGRARWGKHGALPRLVRA